MDRVKRYREIILRELAEYSSWTHEDGVRNEIVESTSGDHFELVRVGWTKRGRVHYTMFHLDIIDGRIWVQHDATDRPIAEALARAGVPKSDIVLGFARPEVRELTGYGVG